MAILFVYGLAMEIFEISKSFPAEEKYALTSQLNNPIFLSFNSEARPAEPFGRGRAGRNDSESPEQLKHHTPHPRLTLRKLGKPERRLTKES